MRRATLLGLASFVAVHLATSALVAWVSIVRLGQFDPKFTPAQALDLDLWLIVGLWTPSATLLVGLSALAARRWLRPPTAARATLVGAATAGALVLVQTLLAVVDREGASVLSLLVAPPIVAGVMLALLGARRASPLAAG